MKDSDTGDTAFHLLVKTKLPQEIVQQVLEVLAEISPQGAAVVNQTGNLPLHTALSQRRIHLSIINLLLKAYPDGAKRENSLGYIPLFLECMKDNSSFEVCKALCQAFPQGPGTKNRTNSYPLHFAAKRRRPNRDILRMLLRRAPEAASGENVYGVLPFHCLVATTDDIVSARMLYEAFKGAACVADRQGRTPLHLAVLAVGKDHSTAIEAIREEKELQCLQEKERHKSKKGGADATGNDNVNYYSSSDEDDSDDEAGKDDEENMNLMEFGSHSREIVRFLIDVNPAALVAVNNFEATPLQTVLEKIRKSTSKYRKLYTFGLYEDPPTARMLLLAHKRLNIAGKVSTGIRLAHYKVLRDLNWQHRRMAIFASYVGVNIGYALASNEQRKKPGIGGSSNSKGGSKKVNHQKGKQVKSSLIQGKKGDAAESMNPIGGNILAKLRINGSEDILRICVAYI
jgi:ankyrin repeat protein